MKMVVFEIHEVFCTMTERGAPKIWQVQPDGTLKDVTDEYSRASIRSHVDNRKH